MNVLKNRQQGSILLIALTILFLLTTLGLLVLNRVIHKQRSIGYSIIQTQMQYMSENGKNTLLSDLEGIKAIKDEIERNEKTLEFYNFIIQNELRFSSYEYDHIYKVGPNRYGSWSVRLFFSKVEKFEVDDVIFCSVTFSAKFVGHIKFGNGEDEMEIFNSDPMLTKIIIGPLLCEDINSKSVL